METFFLHLFHRAMTKGIKSLNRIHKPTDITKEKHDILPFQRMSYIKNRKGQRKSITLQIYGTLIPKFLHLLLENSYILSRPKKVHARND